MKKGIVMGQELIQYVTNRQGVEMHEKATKNKLQLFLMTYNLFFVLSLQQRETCFSHEEHSYVETSCL